LKSFRVKDLLLFAIILLATPLAAQELSCSVTINSTKIQTSDRNVFKDMKTAFEQFMNQRKWTNDNYKQYEKIKCNMLIVINEMPSPGNFTATVQVQSARPVYNTNYNSLIFNFADREWEFEYIESQPLEYNDNTFTTNLTSMLALYAYLIIGVDYDSFAELGGTPYFQKALQVVNNAQSSNRPGWQSLGSNRSRYWIVENYNNNQMVDVRKALYAYHRLALDTYEQDPDKARTIILNALKSIKKIRDINPNGILVISFFDAKTKEITNLFSSGNIQVRREVFDIMTAVDPSNQAAYQKIVQN
jgi:deoxyadenosine/deoxycytidine kinase